MRCVSALLVIGALVAAEAPPRKGEEKPVPAALHGKWDLWKWQHFGQFTTGFAAGKGRPSGKQLSIAGAKAEWTPLGPAITNGEGTVSVDASKKPPRIELRAGKRAYKGLYRLEGDALVICFSAQGADYPKGMEPKAKGGETLCHFTRLPKD
jgi:uncharacterized protein (TIGR03067 family)